MQTLKFQSLQQTSKNKKCLAQRGQNVMFIRCDWQILIHFVALSISVSLWSDGCCRDCDWQQLNSSTIDELGEGKDGRAASNPSWMRRVSMTTLWVATTRNRHTEQTDKTKILTMYLPWEEGGVGREKSSRITVWQRKTWGVSWQPTLSCKLQGAPALNPRPPHTPTLQDTAGQQYCLAFNLA